MAIVAQWQSTGGHNQHKWSIAVAIVAQWQSTGGHNQLS